MMRRQVVGWVFAMWVVHTAAVAHAAELRVGPGATFTEIDAALRMAEDGDIVIIAAGTYEEAITTRAAGVTLRGEGAVTLTAPGRVVDVAHDRFTIENLIVDGQLAEGRTVRVRANGFTLRNSEVRRAGGNCIDLGEVDDVTISDSVIHHCLLSRRNNCQDIDCHRDAHGIVGGAVQGLDVRNTEIHTFSGDAIQVDSDWRDSGRGWDDVHIEGCTFWMAPLAEAIGGYAAGINPSENAIDTKTQPRFGADATMTIVDTVAYGFRSDIINNASAFNLKQDVTFLLDRVTVYDTEIAFRVRGAGGDHREGARATIRNTVVYDVDTAVRYEDALAELTLQHVTFGNDVGREFQDSSSVGPDSIRSANVLLLGDSLPTELRGGPGNLAVAADAFLMASEDDYRLQATGAPVDTAVDVGVTVDRLGVTRPQGAAADVGAYEQCEDCDPQDPGGTDGGADASAPRPDGGVSMPDGGVADAGVRDGAADASSEAEDPSGCQTGSGDPALALLLGLVLLFRRAQPRSKARAR
ncbi:MAG: right-handed parallel beta-helix repeat-containing protein [Myxococcota bacterium]